MEIVYTMHSLAKMLQVSTRTLRREIDEGKLHFVKIRGRLRFRQEDIRGYLHDCSVGDEVLTTHAGTAQDNSAGSMTAVRVSGIRR